jgi:hypothetical protein
MMMISAKLPPPLVDLIPRGYAMKIGKGAVFVYEGAVEGHLSITIPCRDEEEAERVYVAFGDGKMQ